MPLFVDPSGAEQFALHASFQTQAPTDGFSDVVVPLALNLDWISLPEAGTYAFSLRLDGGEAERLPFRVDQAGDAAAPDGAPGGTSTGRGPTDPGYL